MMGAMIGVGSHAESLGIFTDAAVMAAQIADRCDTSRRSFKK